MTNIQKQRHSEQIVRDLASIIRIKYGISVLEFYNWDDDRLADDRTLLKQYDKDSQEYCDVCLDIFLVLDEYAKNYKQGV